MLRIVTVSGRIAYQGPDGETADWVARYHRSQGEEVKIDLVPVTVPGADAMEAHDVPRQQAATGC